MSIPEIRKYYKKRMASLKDIFAPIPNDIDRIGELILALDKRNNQLKNARDRIELLVDGGE